MVEKIETRPVVLVFTSSGGGSLSTFELYADQVLFANALEFIDLSEDPSQLIVCDKCGIIGCQPGGWVSFRRAGDLVLVIPAFDSMEIAEYGLEEYRPPDYFKDMGFPCFDIPLYKKLMKMVTGSRGLTRLTPLTVGEAIRLFQWESPYKVLGRFPDPPLLNEEMILDIVKGEREKELEKVRNFVTHYAGSSIPLVPIKHNQRHKAIEILLDMPGFPVWRRFATIGDDICILMGHKLIFGVTP